MHEVDRVMITNFFRSIILIIALLSVVFSVDITKSIKDFIKK